MAKGIPPFFEVSWYRVNAELVNLRLVPYSTSHPLSIINAIIKGVTKQAFPDDKELLVFFHIKKRRFTFSLREGVKVPLEIFFLRKTKEEVDHWLKTFENYLKDAKTGKNFSFLSLSPPEERYFYRLWEELGIKKTEGEICLEFLTPFPFKPPEKKRRTFIDKETFLSSFTNRFSRLFNKKFFYQSERDNFSLLPYYWRYTEIRHQPKSESGIQYIKGCIGKLYIKGSFTDFLPFLILGSELHTGPKISNSQGYYLLLEKSPPYFASHFPDKKAILPVIREVREKYDSPLAIFSAGGEIPLDEEKLAEEIYQEIKNGAYQPKPNTAFLIKKKESGDRLIEELSFKDLVVQEYLLKTLRPILENTFEPESIGFRKGFSREKAVSLFQKAVSDGYQYLIESDIEDFFSSVDLALLIRLLDFYLPENDILLKDILFRCLKNGYIRNGNFYSREKGLAQGSPLSPILANLYLDSFDEKIKSWNVRLIRYADDFIILTKTKKEAEEILTKGESFLSELGLKLNRKKTAIRPIKEGFQFLGIRFTPSEVVVEPEEEFRRMKKPLYITEPYLFLSVNGEAVEIKQKGVVVEVIPLRRVSEIMVMEKSVFSTALVKKCTELGIPLTITLNTGYYITTVKPDSKRYYEIVSEHSRKYHSLSQTELLCFAQEIAQAKIKNYISLFRQRYQPGQSQFIRRLEGVIEKIAGAGSIEEVRGFEGFASKIIYQQLNTIIDDPAFHIQNRERHKPDRINSLLNFGSYLLFARINATIRAVGLNPYLGFLHSPSDEYESLAYDIQELFRPRIDRFIIRLVNLKVIKKDDFNETRDGAYLKKEAVKKFINQFEAEMTKKEEKKELSLQDNLYIQVLIIKKWVMESSSLTFYTWLV